MTYFCSEQLIRGEKKVHFLPFGFVEKTKVHFCHPPFFALVLDEKVCSGSKFGFAGSKFDGELESGVGLVGSGRGSALPVFSGFEP